MPDIQAVAGRGRAVLALLFCFLAVSFALEAKMAMYQPARETGFNVRASKEMPADSRDVDSGGRHVHLAPPSHLPATVMGIVATIVTFDPARRYERRPVLLHAALPAALVLTPLHSFRPPPIR